jgi:hypothetical protein
MTVVVLMAAVWIAVIIVVVAACVASGRFDHPAAPAQASSTTAAPSARKGP